MNGNPPLRLTEGPFEAKLRPMKEKPTPRREPVVIYTDGACSGNPGPAACAAALSYQGKEKKVSRYLGIGTNNVAELEAVRLALGLLKRKDLPIDLHTDSTYVIGVLTQGWKAKANQELIAQIKALLGKFPELRLVKVPGHAGVPLNELVDQMARDAVLLRSGTEA